MNEINSLLIAIRAKVLRIEKGVVKGQEAGDFFADAVRKAKEIYTKDTDEWRMLDRWEHESGYQWHPVYKSETYAGEKDKQKLLRLSAKLEEISNTTPIIATEKDEYSFSNNQKYEAQRLLVSIFKGAKESFWVVDNYLDEVIFDFLDVIPNAVSINIITTNRKPIFKQLYLAMKEKGIRKVEARTNEASHDRYIVIDEKILYSLGASLDNSFGKRDFMIHRLTEKTDEVMQKIKTWWANGQEIV